MCLISNDVDALSSGGEERAAVAEEEEECGGGGREGWGRGHSQRRRGWPNRCRGTSDEVDWKKEVGVVGMLNRQ